MHPQSHPLLESVLAELGLPAALHEFPLEYQAGFLAGLREVCLAWQEKQAPGTVLQEGWRRKVLLCSRGVHLVIRLQQGRLSV